MGKKYDFDYIIIGSGPAGRTAALSLAKAGKRVAIVEAAKFGGTDINTRDLPYNYTLDFIHTFYKLTKNRAMSGQDLHFNFPTLISEQEHLVAAARESAKSSLVGAGVAIINGYANFLDKNTVAIQGKEYTSQNFIIATGSELNPGNISGLETVKHFTPETAIKIRRKPEFVFIIGGGSTGCELAEYYAKLGSHVLILEKGSRLLPREDKDISTAVTEYFEKDLGIMVITGAKAVAITEDNVSKNVIFTTAGQEKMVRVDCIILATGSAPSINCGLENADVTYKNSGIAVNQYFETSAKNIFAIGDVASGKNIDATLSSTARSVYEAQILVSNLLHKTKFTANYSSLAREVNIYPTISVIGPNERDLSMRGQKFNRTIINLDDKNSFIKILTSKKGDILGVTIMAPNARLIAEKYALMMQNHIKPQK